MFFFQFGRQKFTVDDNFQTDINDLHGNLSRISFEPPPCRDITRISLEVTQHRQAGWKMITDTLYINTTLIL